MNFTRNPYFTILEKIELLQRWIIVHSIIYYELNQSIVTDSQFDNNCNQLVELMRKYPKLINKSKYSYCFYDFDGSTGFHLVSRLNIDDYSKLFLDAYRLCERRK